MTETELHFTLFDKMNSAVEIGRQAAAVRSFIEQDLLRRDDVQIEIIRLIGLLTQISTDVSELVWELDLKPNAGGELSEKTRELLDELRNEVELCKEMLDESRDLFIDGFNYDSTTAPG
jgi:hypothetical protein